MELSEQPLAGAEFIVVDTETNGLGGDACELTEIGTVLVGGGELHDRWESLVRTNMPLGRGIQRFTGITQDQIDAAPDPEAVLPSLALLLQGRVMVAHSAAFDRRVLRQAFGRVGLEWPDPPVLCTAALARAVLPLQRARKLTLLADALGIEVDIAHRALADAETCARILCALFPRLCAHAATIGDAVALLRSRRRSRGAGASKQSGRQYAAGARELPQLDFEQLPQDPGVYIFRDGAGRPLYVGKSVSIRRRARAHFAPSTQRAAWTAHAEIVDYRATTSELGALILENRLIKELKPPGNVRLTSRVARAADEHHYICCRLDISFPILEVAQAPAAGHAVSIGPLRGRRWAAELVEQLDSIFGLRHCGRKLPRRDAPSAYGQMGRCLSPCLGDLDPNLYRRRLDEALRVFHGDARRLLLDRLDEQMRAAAGELNYERAAALHRRRRGLEAILGSLDGALEATHVRPRLILAPHPAEAGRFDALWLAGGRLLDFGPLPGGAHPGPLRPGAPLDPAELHDRTARVLARAGRIGELGAHVPPGEIDELRILGTYLASHPDLPSQPLDPAPDAPALNAFVRRAQMLNGSSQTSALTLAPASTLVPGGASRRTRARAIGPSRGDTAALVT